MCVINVNFTEMYRDNEKPQQIDKMFFFCIVFIEIFNLKSYFGKDERDILLF